MTSLSDKHKRCLREYRTRVGELVSHEIIKLQKLKGPNPRLALLAPIIRKVHASNISPDDLLEELERTDPLLVKDFTRVLRFFWLKKEPSWVNTVVDVIKSLGDPDLLERARSIKKEFYRSPGSVRVNAKINGQEIVLDAAKAHDLFENGEVMHSTPGKREQFLLVDSSMLSDFAYSVLMQNLIAQSNAVIDLYLLLRDSKVIDAVDDEPEWLRR